MTVWSQSGDDLLLSPADPRIGKGGCRRRLSARVRAVPEKGRANVALIALLAKRLDWQKGAILLESGDTNRLKRLRITGGGEAAARLIALIEHWVEKT